MADDGIVSLRVTRVVHCTHPAYPNKRKDFSELWRGASDDPKDGKRRGSWGGGFRGRPRLAEQLFEAIQGHLALKKPGIIQITFHALRTFWRFLDRYEAAGFKPVEELGDLHSGHSVLWQQPVDDTWEVALSQPNYTLIGKLIRQSREKSGLKGPFAWEPFAHREVPEKDLPTDAEVREAMWLLKTRIRATFARWERADRLAASGRNLLGIEREATGRRSDGTYPRAYGQAVTEGDLHATYRALIAQSGKAVPTLRDLFEALEMSVQPTWWPKLGEGHPDCGARVRWRDLVEGLYPNLNDVCFATCLCMARSGWNSATVLDLDISRPDWAVPYGELGSTLWLVQSFKGRSHEWQWTLSQERLSTGVYSIVRRFQERTSFLRQWLGESGTQPGVDVLAKASPWPYVLLRSVSGAPGTIGTVGVLNSDNLSAVSGTWKKAIRAHNESSGVRTKIPDSFVPSDWRDVFASFVFLQSRYSLLLLQWALGHKSMHSVRDYLRKKLWRRYSEKRVHDLQTAVIDGIEVSRRVDATVLRAKLEHRMDPSEAALGRLARHRAQVRERDLSYSGHDCLDRRHPPPEIDPGNPSNGTIVCRSGERCASCPLGMAIDSFHMAKRLAELHWIRRNVSETVWAESHYATDIMSLEASLKQWPANEVDAHLAHWAAEISAGRHRVIRFGAMR